MRKSILPFDIPSAPREATRRAGTVANVLAALGTVLVALGTVLAPGCTDADAADFALIDDFLAGSTAVTCEAVTLEPGPAAEEIRLVSDSTWIVLDGTGRELFEFDDALRLRGRLAIPRRGPGSAEQPVSVAALGDTAWAIADRARLRVVVLSRTGEEVAAVPLDFMPHSLESTPGGELLLTAVPVGTRPPTLLVRYDWASFQPLPVPRRSYPDMTVSALGNTALVETLPDGAALVVHQFLAPRAFRVGTGPPEPLRAPTPDATRDQIDYVPTAPVTEDQLPRTLTPALAMSVDPGSGEVYLLTRSGRTRNGRPERAVLRLAGDLGFTAGFTLDVHAVGLVYLPRREAAIVVDDEDRFFLCPLPRAEYQHAGAE